MTSIELLDVIAAFSQRESYCKKRLCFFVDGLDEYVGNHADLVKLIGTLSNSVKTCVSSRSWNVYSKAYTSRADGQLVLDDLTTRDIRRYVRESM
jgi:hypothetical protein